MSKYIQHVMTLLVLAALLVSCGKNETPELVAAKWCELNLKAYTASGQEQESARAAKEAYEKEVDDKYFTEAEFYTSVLNQMKACEAELQNNAPESIDAETLLPLAYSNAETAARAYCELVDQSISVAKNGNDAEIKKIVSVKLIFEKNMDDSYADNPERMDSIFKLIEPCMSKEVQFRSQ